MDTIEPPDLGDNGGRPRWFGFLVIALVDLAALFLLVTGLVTVVGWFLP
ncbi:MAG: hypothetical protein ABIQ18_39760 [Umezawaea sp.]